MLSGQTTVWGAGMRRLQSLTGSIPVPRTNGPRTSVAIFEAALRRACALRVLPESAGLDVCSPPLGPLAA
jgi:hypothetical protein